ncbi:15470_t:CDS:2 [Gigaspora margarita]|uniref:15470_t:CDS:1 n=1 Tax=Gigaspora margarita TaxID=4874 RepID=A0ABN7VVX9_GIGMA|nr:15470_t:CDS:2 [Gigaspora margarita]
MGIKKALKVKVLDRTEKGNKSKSTGQDKRFKENKWALLKLAG